MISWKQCMKDMLKKREDTNLYSSNFLKSGGKNLFHLIVRMIKIRSNVCLPKVDYNSMNKFYHRKMFERFVHCLNSSPYRIRKSCPFNYIYSFFSYLKIDKQTARIIIDFWIGERWCERSKYYGLRLNGGENYAW